MLRSAQKSKFSLVLLFSSLLVLLSSLCLNFFLKSPAYAANNYSLIILDKNGQELGSREWTAGSNMSNVAAFVSAGSNSTYTISFYDVTNGYDDPDRRSLASEGATPITGIDPSRISSSSFTSNISSASFNFSLQVLKDGQELGTYASNGKSNAHVNITKNAVTGETTTNSTTAETKIDDECNKSSALGWLMCPLAESLSAAAQNLYEKLFVPALEVEASYVNNDNVRGIWGTFRDVANIVLVILLLVIAISQITGIGIDNYGIKKTLPKLIVAAVLINLSFIVCQLAVDASNIIGNSLIDLFEQLGSGISYGANGGTGAGVATVAAILAGFIAYLAIPGIAKNIGLILAIIGGILTFIISVVAAFLMLSVRKAGVIILVILSPLAFAAYMLPNTKKLFDKWMHILITLLVLYPMCSLLIGGGALVGKVIFVANDESGASFFANLTALVISVAPIFLIPSLTRSTISALGTAGGRLANWSAGLGRRVSGRATGAISRTQRFGEIQNEQNRLRQANYANRRLNALNRSKERNDQRISEINNLLKDPNLTARERSRLQNELTTLNNRNESNNLRRARAQGIINRQTAEDVEARAGVRPINEAALLAKAESERNARELDAEEAVMKAETSNFDPNVMNDQLTTLLKRDDLSDAEQLRARALMHRLSLSGGYGQNLLHKTIEKNATEKNRKLAATFMAKNSDVAAGINKKNTGMAQYLRDINADREFTFQGKQIKASALSFNDWAEATYTDDNGNVISNMQNVIDNVLTDDRDFTAQSAGVVKRQLSMKDSSGAALFSNDKLERILNNDILMKNIDGDVRTEIENAAKARGIALPSNNSPVVEVRASANYVDRRQPVNARTPIRINTMSDGTYVDAVTGATIAAADMVHYQTEEHATQDEILKIHRSNANKPPVNPNPNPPSGSNPAPSNPGSNSTSGNSGSNPAPNNSGANPAPVRVGRFAAKFFIPNDPLRNQPLEVYRDANGKYVDINGNELKGFDPGAFNRLDS